MLRDKKNQDEIRKKKSGEKARRGFQIRKKKNESRGPKNAEKDKENRGKLMQSSGKKSGKERKSVTCSNFFRGEIKVARKNFILK